MSVAYEINDRGIRGGYYVSCDNIYCNCSILHGTEEEAVEAWNRRDGKP